VSFPTHLLDGYQHAFLSVGDDQATLLVFVAEGGIDGLARDLARRCRAGIVSRTGPSHYTIEHDAFRGDLTRCVPFPGTAVLEVRAPDLDIRNGMGALPLKVGRYVLAETGSLWWGVMAGLGTLAIVTHFAPHVAEGSSVRGGRTWNP
jgi:hypothetical protein